MKMIKLLFISTVLSFVMIGCGGSTSMDSNGEKLTKPIEAGDPILSNWYIRLVAEDPERALLSTNAQLGVLNEADAVENHSLKALEPFDGTHLDIVFVDPIGVAPGNYRSNFHVYQEGMEERWRFAVRTDDSNAKILLSWRGLFVLTPYIDDQNRIRYSEYRSLNHSLVERMKLIDADIGTEIAAVVDGEKQTYILDMNGQTQRVFEWVVQNDAVTLPVEESEALAVEMNRIQKSTSIDEREVEKRVISFDLEKPPVFKEVDHAN